MEEKTREKMTADVSTARGSGGTSSGAGERGRTEVGDAD